VRPCLCLVLALPVATLSHGKVRSDQKPDLQTFPKPAVPNVANPMANFERLVSGEWLQKSLSGQTMYHTWYWGPGKHSIRRMTEGSGAGGQPWHEIQVFYWHPGRNQICLLGLSPFDRGVNEGVIKFEGDKAEGVSDLYQTAGRRNMGLRWAITGPDKYQETLLEATGTDGFQPLVHFDHLRAKPPAVPRPRKIVGERPSRYLKAFELLLGHAWETKSTWANGEPIHIRKTFEWVPFADAIYGRLIVPEKDGNETHLLDGYIYHHTGTQVLRCLAVSNTGGVFEGDLTVLENGAIQAELKSYEGGRVFQYLTRIDMEKDGTLRDRVWSLKGIERNILLDIYQKRLKEK